MLLGEKQKLVLVKHVEFGVYLAEEVGADETVLLPKKQVPEGAQIGDEIEVFLYKDSKDRLIATVKEPKLTMGGVAKLRVAQTGDIGAFLDWGLEKELLLPFKEQTMPVKTGDEVLVALYTDKSERLCATMKIYPYLEKGSSYNQDDRVTGMVYEISQEFGAFVAVDDRYSALIPKKELYGEVRVGQIIEARVTSVKEDGKIDLSIRQKAHVQMETDAVRILELMEQSGGRLDFTDKADPELIRERTGMSKNEFKRAIGTLYKQRKIVIGSETIEIAQK